MPQPATARSVDSEANVNSPDWRKPCPRAAHSIVASSRWLVSHEGEGGRRRGQ